MPKTGLPMLEVCAHLVNSSTLEMGQVSRADLERLQRNGYEGRQLIHELLTDDWGAPPRFVELTGHDEVGHPVRIVIHYD